MIDSHLIAARKVASGWDGAMATELARTFGSQGEAVIDWDEGAGESWVRLIVGNAVVAYVSILVPLVIRERDATWFGRDSGVQEIVVETMASRELSSARGALEAAFGYSPRLDNLDAERFSADELWYATV